MVMSKDLGKMFSIARENNRLTVEEVSEKTRIHLQMVCDIEAGVFDRLNKLYTKSFVKKYAQFIGLNVDDVMKKFESISADIPEVKFDPQEVKPEDEEKKKQADITEILKKIDPKTAKIAAIAIGSLIMGVMFISMIRSSAVRFADKRREAAVIRTEAKKPEAKKTKKTVIHKKKVKEKIIEKQKEKLKAGKVVIKKEKKTALKNIFTKPVKKTEAVTLRIHAHGEVWLKLTEGDNTLYVGTMEEGDDKTWKAAGPVTLWTGKAERITLTVNHNKVKSIGAGVIKDVKITAKGINIDNTRVVEFE